MRISAQITHVHRAPSHINKGTNRTQTQSVVSPNVTVHLLKCSRTTCELSKRKAKMNFLDS